MRQPWGNRVSKTAAGLSTYYVRDAQGNTLGVYDNNSGTTNWREQQLYGSSRLGMWKPDINLSNDNASTVWDTIGKKTYELTNHLGNVMAVISDKRTLNGSTYEADVLSAQDYYAFGPLMPGRTYTAPNSNYRYGQGGHEKLDEVAEEGNNIDMGARILDTRLGRTSSIDTKAALYPGISPYAYALNTPVQAIDPDGNVVIFINGQHGGTFGKAYWEGFDEKIMRRIGDKSKRYYDGALGGFKNTFGNYNSYLPLALQNSNLSPIKRYGEGYMQAKLDAADIISKLQRDENGKITESIKIISHSMGGTYAKGFAQGIMDYVKENNEQAYLNRTNGLNIDGTYNYYKKLDVNIEFEVDFASFQPNFQTTVEGVRTIQVSHKNDKVVNHKLGIAGSKETKMTGVKNGDYHLDNDNKDKGHSLNTFTDEVKYVPKSNSNPKEKKP